MAVQDTFGKNGKCSICKLSEIDSLNYGEIHVTKDYSVHLFCLYFSSDLPQNGKDTAGIVGFEIRDIRTLIVQCVNVKCCYCDKGSATTQCHHPNCRRVFHQVCGFKANARFEYLGQFRSFCHKHNQIENEKLHYPKGVIGCFVCYERLGDYNPVQTVPSCCGLWFHQQCLRKYAINAGYAFMCPTCSNKNYSDFARRHGIYVPEYVALWEKTHDYADIERFYTNCDASNCVCPNGRKFSNPKWNLQLCSCCGSYGYHRLCRPKCERKDIIICDVCSKTASKWSTNESENVNLQPNLNEESEGERKDAANDAVETIDLTDDHILDQCIVSDVQEITGERKDGADDAVEVVDFTDDHSFKQCIATGIKEIIGEVDIVLPQNEETLAEKRAREKAMRPITDEMRNFRISLWFRDYKRRK